jgi:hypothetical protein
MEARLWFSHCRSCSTSTVRVATDLVEKTHVFSLSVGYFMTLSVALFANCRNKNISKHSHITVDKLL